MQLHYYIDMDEYELESSLTDRYQTTVPARIRKLLGLNKRDKLEWILDESGGVRVSRLNPAAIEHADPTVDAWLDFLAKDMANHPERLVPLTSEMYEDIVAELSGERGIGIEGLPPTLEELWAQEEDTK
ncbi:MAG: regulator [Micrococcales bacterium]|nr:regulator [Micrococcales bacterium]